MLTHSKIILDNNSGEAPVKPREDQIPIPCYGVHKDRLVLNDESTSNKRDEPSSNENNILQFIVWNEIYPSSRDHAQGYQA